MKQPKISVGNVRNGLLRDHDLHIYCGRSVTPAGMLRANMGNPFHMTSEQDRDAVCDNYACWLEGQGPDDHARKVIHRLADKLAEGKSIALYCHCAPKRCHCDSIAQFALATAKNLEALRAGEKSEHDAHHTT